MAANLAENVAVLCRIWALRAVRPLCHAEAADFKMQQRPLCHAAAA